MKMKKTIPALPVKDIKQSCEYYSNNLLLHSPDTVVEEQYWGDKEFAAVDLHRNLLTFYEPIIYTPLPVN